ncbi:MAG: PQQ-dependent dehydrogenase, methanol/ethanol family [Alphaproteobacteria bacterium]|nr:PQQ-dependent dehydrogenase, methanol/ethanol family [Alphaproteobacteria bacterium]
MKHTNVTTAVAAGALATGLALTLAMPATARDMTQARLENANAEPDNWLVVNGNYAAHRFANLSQINKTNVQNLTPRMMLLLAGQVPAQGGRYAVTRLEGTPAAEDGFLFVSDGWGAIYKVDVRSGSRADFVWKMDPQIDKVWAGDVACCGVDNRGVGLWKDSVISIALDGRMFAINKGSGEVKWERKIADPAVAETLTVAPLVIRDIAIVGAAGAEYGIRGWLDATDLNTGKQVWRTHTAGGNDRDPTEKAKTTWLDNYNSWETGGGSIWQTGTFDPKLNLTYWGTGNAGPDYDQEYRPGDNLYVASVLAMKPEDGFIKWFFQYTPGDPFDYDEIGEHPLIDIGGKTLVVHAARNGHFYGFDRATGAFQYGKAYPTVVTWSGGIDPKTGRPMTYVPGAPQQKYAPGSVADRGGAVGMFCPAITGGKNWEPTSYNPTLGLIYVPSNEGCAGMRTATKLTHFEGKLDGTTKRRANWTGGGTLNAQQLTERNLPDTRPIVTGSNSLNVIDVTTGEVKTKVMLKSKVWGTVTTAGGLVFGCDQFGDIMAWDATNLTPLWSFNVGTPCGAPPMSYGFNGKQYVAVEVGYSPANAQTATQAGRAGSNLMTPSNYLMIFGL